MAFLSFAHHNTAAPATVPGSVYAVALARFQHQEELSAVEKQALLELTGFAGRLTRPFIQQEAGLARDFEHEAHDEKTELFQMTALKQRLNYFLNPMQATTGRKHVLAYARIDDYDELCAKFGEADAEDEFLVPAAGIFRRSLPNGTLAARNGNDFVAFIPDTDLITMLLQSEQVEENAAGIHLPRPVDGSDRLGLSMSLVQIRPLEDLDHHLDRLQQELISTVAFGPRRIVHDGQVTQS